MKPEGATFDDLGRGEEEGVSNVSELSESAATKSLEVLKQISSTGYLRKRLPQDLVVLNGGQTGRRFANRHGPLKPQPGEGDSALVQTAGATPEPGGKDDENSARAF